MIIYHFRPYDMAYDYSVEVPDGPSIPQYFAFEKPPEQEGYYAIMREGWVLVEGTLPPLPPPDPNERRRSMAVTPLQAKVALYNAGLLDEVENYVNDRSTDIVVKLAWSNAIQYERLSPMILSIGSTLGLTPEQIDALFDEAAEVSV